MEWERGSPSPSQIQASLAPQLPPPRAPNVLQGEALEQAWALDSLVREEVLKYQHAHLDASLAQPTPQWAWLKDITPAYLHKRALRMWIDKNREQNISGETSWPWTTPCLSETNWFPWKVLCIANKGKMGAMTLKEEGRYALY